MSQVHSNQDDQLRRKIQNGIELIEKYSRASEHAKLKKKSMELLDWAAKDDVNTQINVYLGLSTALRGSDPKEAYKAARDALEIAQKANIFPVWEEAIIAAFEAIERPTKIIKPIYIKPPIFEPDTYQPSFGCKTPRNR